MILAVLRKEFLELRQTKMALFPIILVPTIFLLTLWFTLGSMGGDPASLAPGVGKLVDHWMIMMLMVPMLVPSVILAYSIIGEKTEGTLEPLLASPVPTSTLLLSKILAGVLPGLLMMWASGFAACGLVNIQCAKLGFSAGLPDDKWLASLFTLGPALSVFIAILCVMISSRVNDVRAAQQFTAVGILPLLIVGMSLLSGKITIDAEILMQAAAVVAVLCIIGLRFAVRIFQREHILTRWKF